jgi:GNAT superfamily N-acetyltransferase
VAGAYAMFDGVGSPLTQTFGLGLFAEVGEAEFAALEAFFQRRGAEAYHEISPLAAPALLPHLNERGYQPIEFTGVMFRPVTGALPGAPAAAGLQVRRVKADEADLWAGIAAEGWSSESAELVDFIREMGQISARAASTFCFLAELDGQPVAAGGLSVGEGVALLAGASTIPAARRKGAQRALLEARLRFAAEQGCDLVMICAQPGSASQRNASGKASALPIRASSGTCDARRRDQSMRVVARRAEEPVRLVRFPGQTFFQTPRRKLKWGDLAEREGDEITALASRAPQSTIERPSASSFLLRQRYRASPPGHKYDHLEFPNKVLLPVIKDIGAVAESDYYAVGKR